MKKLAAILSAALLSGCINVMYRTDGTSKNYGPYYCTGIMSASVAAPFSDPVGPEGGIAKAWCTLLLPVTIIDLPLEAVADTLLLPWDLCVGDRQAEWAAF